MEHVVEDSPRSVPVPVCDRCKHRRQKCDKNLEGCASCTAAAETCCFSDPESGQTLPRLYVKQLEDRLQELRAKQALAAAASPHHPITPFSISSPTSEFPSGRLNKRYLGDSSGLVFIRSCINLARAQGILHGPSNTHRKKRSLQMKLGQLPELLAPTDGIPLNRDTMDSLFAVFADCQIHHPILTRSEFDSYMTTYFEPAAKDHLSTACIHMVFAIAVGSMGNIEDNTTALKLAEMSYQRVLGDLHHILYPRSLQSLQVILLILHFSFSNPQQPVVWHLVGYALRLATALGLHNDTSTASSTKNVDLGRRLFWSLYSFDRAVGNTLGRPTGLQDADISAFFPDVCSEDSGKDRIANHCFRLRQMQSRVADVLYQRTLPFAENFIDEAQLQIDKWLEEVPIDACSTEMIDWFNHAYHNLSVFLHRPSVANPEPTTSDIQRCFKSSEAVMRLYWKLYKSGAVDCTWMAIHWLFLAGVVHLYCIWTHENIRNSVDWSLVLQDTQTTSMVLTAMAEKWKSAEGIPHVYHNLCIGTFQKYGELYPQSDGESIIPDG